MTEKKIPSINFSEDDIHLIRRSLSERDPGLLPSRILFEGFEPYEALFLRLVSISCSLTLDDSQSSDSIFKRGARWIYTEGQSPLTSTELIDHALALYERNNGHNCFLSYSEYKELMVDALSAALGGPSIIGLSPMIQNAVLSNLISFGAPDDDFDPWDPVVDPRFGR